MAVPRKIDVPFDISLPIALDGSFSVFKYSSFSEGYQVYKDKWQSNMGDESLYCEEEEKDNEYDKHAIAIIFDSFHSNKVAGHVPVCWGQISQQILKISKKSRLLCCYWQKNEQRHWSRTRDTS